MKDKIKKKVRDQVDKVLVQEVKWKVLDQIWSEVMSQLKREINNEK